MQNLGVAEDGDTGDKDDYIMDENLVVVARVMKITDWNLPLLCRIYI